MRNQITLLGVFLIVVGIMIFVYWILLPISEKEKILQEIYGKENISEKNNTYDISKTDKESLMINNIYLYSGKKEIVISENYTIGNLVGFQEDALENIFVKTNMFSGVKSKKISFRYHEGEGVVFSFLLKCKDGKIEIFVNDILFFEGCSTGLQEFYIPSEYLSRGYNSIIIKFYPASIFSDSIFEINNFKIISVKRSSITFDYFYNYDEKVFLIYNFCPTDPNSIELCINGIKVPLYSCAHNLFEITKYLNKGQNIIELKSKTKSQINLKILTTSGIFVQVFNLTSRNYFLYVIKSKGSGEIYINTCKFYLEPYKEVNIFLVNEKCINRGENVLIVKPDNFLEINSLFLR